MAEEKNPATMQDEKPDNNVSESSSSQSASNSEMSVQNTEEKQVNSEVVSTSSAQTVNQSAPAVENSNQQVADLQKDEVVTNKVKTTTEERSLAGAAYIPFIGFITATLKSESKFCLFHSNQGITLTGVFFLVIFFLLVESAALGITIFGSLAFLGWFALSIAAAVRAFQGDMWEIPVISSIAQKIDLSKFLVPEVKIEDNTQNQATTSQAANTESKTDQPATPESEVKPEENIPKE